MSRTARLFRKPLATTKARPAVVSDDEASLRAVFAHNLRLARVAVRMSQADLGRRAGTTQKYISSLERKGGNVGIDLLARLSRVLEVPAAELLTPVARGPQLLE